MRKNNEGEEHEERDFGEIDKAMTKEKKKKAIARKSMLERE